MDLAIIKRFEAVMRFDDRFIAGLAWGFSSSLDCCKDLVINWEYIGSLRLLPLTCHTH